MPGLPLQTRQEGRVTGPQDEGVQVQPGVSIRSRYVADGRLAPALLGRHDDCNARDAQANTRTDTQVQRTYARTHARTLGHVPFGPVCCVCGVCVCVLCVTLMRARARSTERYGAATSGARAEAGHSREFRDVVFEDVGFENNMLLTLSN